MSKIKKALERAKKERGDLSQSPSKKILQEDNSINPVSDREQEEINISYRNTKILNINPNNLKKNKIFTHLKENEVTEQISIIRTQLLNKLDELGGNTLMVTSAHPGEGKTFMSINLGVSIAQELNRTALIVDCDLRRPVEGHFDFASDFFGVQVEQGLSDYLLGQADLENVMYNPGIERLTILPGGRPLLNSAELLSSMRMVKLVNEMKSRYGKDRIIIFDSPSMLQISDPLAFSRFVDGVLLVVQANKTSNSEVKKIIKLLKDRTILGTILNKVK